MCKYKHWPWRRKVVTFNTVLAQPLYDLSASNVTTPDISGAPDVDEIIAVVLFQGAASPPNPPPFSELDPIFDGKTQMAAQRDTTQDVPTNYFKEPGTDFSLRLTPIANAAYPIGIAYWASPNPKDITKDTIPLIPPFDHDVLVAGLVMDFDKIIYGAESNKFQLSAAEYQAALENMTNRRDFSVGRHDSFTPGEEMPRSSINWNGMSGW